MGICFFIVFAAVGLAGARFRRKPPTSASSGWNRRQNESGEEKRTSFAGKENKEAVDAGLRPVGGPQRQWWAIVLIPFLSLLSLVAKEEDDTLPTHVYTLF